MVGDGHGGGGRGGVRGDMDVSEVACLNGYVDVGEHGFEADYSSCILFMRRSL